MRSPYFLSPPKIYWVPIFEGYFPLDRQNIQFFVIHPDFVCQNEEEARQVGRFAPEDLDFTGEVRKVDFSCLPHIRATFGDWDVAIVSGPTFDRMLDENRA